MEATTIAKISFPSFKIVFISLIISLFLFISNRISRKKLLSSASSSTIFNLFIKSAVDLAL